jgi:hypothetical protein
MSRGNDTVDTKTALWVTHVTVSIADDCPVCKKPAVGWIRFSFWVDDKLVERSACLPCFRKSVAPLVKKILAEDV